MTHLFKLKYKIGLIVLIGLLFFARPTQAAYILIPMDENQSNHLKSYGIAYWIIESGVSIDWLLNYKGGSFMFPYAQIFEDECNIRGVSYQIIADATSSIYCKRDSSS